ncbi:MAG TPA: hypothetical protein VHQ03_00290 [Candidatus Dormibacteraeota bacterium]|nr:hypothetical protein [Candidatus Dormibacteraeota bacterium]
MIKAETTSRPEAVFVLVLLQSMFWLIAGISAAPFVLGGEIYMGALAVVTILFALGTFLCAIGVLWRRRRARALTIAIEVLCLFGSAVLMLLPIGFNRGLVSILVNVGLPLAVIVLLRKDAQEVFS